jgi:hypothetical protein
MCLAVLTPPPLAHAVQLSVTSHLQFLSNTPPTHWAVVASE